MQQTSQPGGKKGDFPRKTLENWESEWWVWSNIEGIWVKKKLIPQFMGIKTPDKLKMIPNIPKFSSVFHEIQI